MKGEAMIEARLTLTVDEKTYSAKVVDWREIGLDSGTSPVDAEHVAEDRALNAITAVEKAVGQMVIAK